VGKNGNRMSLGWFKKVQEGMNEKEKKWLFSEKKHDRWGKERLSNTFATHIYHYVKQYS